MTIWIDRLGENIVSSPPFCFCLFGLMFFGVFSSGTSMRRRFNIFEVFSDIKKSFSDIRNSNSWYKQITVIFWYQEIDFLISLRVCHIPWNPSIITSVFVFFGRKSKQGNVIWKRRIMGPLGKISRTIECLD